MRECRTPEASAKGGPSTDLHPPIKKPPFGGLFIGGQRGISNPRTAFTVTHFPGVRLQPLGHLSALEPREIYCPGLPASGLEMPRFPGGCLVLGRGSRVQAGAGCGNAKSSIASGDLPLTHHHLVGAKGRRCSTSASKCARAMICSAGLAARACCTICPASKPSGMATNRSSRARDIGGGQHRPSTRHCRRYAPPARRSRSPDRAFLDHQERRAALQAIGDQLPTRP